MAKRKLGDIQRDLGKVDASQGRLTLEELCTRYLATVQNQAPATIRRKMDTLDNLKEYFPAGKGVQVAHVKPSDLGVWLAKYDFGYASHNLYVECVRAFFRMAVSDKVLLVSPAENLKRKKVVKPIRLTPTFEEFQKIVTSVRAQKFNAEVERSADYLEFMGRLGAGQAEIAGLDRSCQLACAPPGCALVQ